MSAFRRFGASLFAAVAALSGHAFASEIALSGTVLGTDAKPLSGVTVSLALAKVSATTDASGAWSLATTPTGIASRVAVPVAHGRLMLQDGRLSVDFEGWDVSGRGMGRSVATQRPLAVAARSADIPDTLLYSWNGTIRLRDTISASQAGIVRTLDTTQSASIITYGSVTHGGQSYKTVKIGTQTWMAENLNYAGTGGTTGKCYKDSADYCATYGRLYTWAEVMQGATTSATSPSGVQGICPTSWHVPSDAEWQTLEVAMGMSAATAATSGWRGTTEGTKLKSTAGWNSSGNGTDDYGFRALPGGGFNGTSFYNVGYFGYWWSATEHDASIAWYRSMGDGYDYVNRIIHFKIIGFSLRCVKD